MTLLHFPLYNFANGTFMIVIFALVCIGLVIALAIFMNSGSKSENSTDSFKNTTETKKEESMEKNKEELLD